MTTARRGTLVLGGLAAALAMALLSAALGALTLDLPTLISIASARLGLPSDHHTLQQAAVFEQIRLPRVVFGLLCGAVLGLCGAVLQGLFRNPLADPGLLGITTGAALAVGLVVVVAPEFRTALGPWALPLAAFAGSLGAAALVWVLARRTGREPTASLLLSGVAVTALGGAGTGLLIALARDADLRDLTFWSLGSLGGVTWPLLGAALPFLAVPFLFVPWMARHLDALLLGDREARTLGTPVDRVRLASLFLTAGGVGAATALAGGVGFVGLVAPHLARFLVGPGHRALLPLAACLGATLTVGADTLARLVVAPAELPLGVVLAFVGAPFLLKMVLGSGGTR